MIANHSYLSVLVLLYMTVHHVYGNYDCLCSGHVERAIYPVPAGTAAPLGHLYEYDCLPLAVGETSTPPWVAVLYEHKVSYINQDSLITHETCFGDVPLQHKLIETKPTNTRATSSSVAPSHSTSASTILPSTTYPSSLWKSWKTSPDNTPYLSTIQTHLSGLTLAESTPSVWGTSYSFVPTLRYTLMTPYYSYKSSPYSSISLSSLYTLKSTPLIVSYLTSFPYYHTSTSVPYSSMSSSKYYSHPPSSAPHSYDQNALSPLYLSPSMTHSYQSISIPKSPSTFSLQSFHPTSLPYSYRSSSSSHLYQWSFSSFPFNPTLSHYLHQPTSSSYLYWLFSSPHSYPWTSTNQQSPSSRYLYQSVLLQHSNQFNSSYSYLPHSLPYLHQSMPHSHQSTAPSQSHHLPSSPYFYPSSYSRNLQQWNSIQTPFSLYSRYSSNQTSLSTRYMYLSSTAYFQSTQASPHHVGPTSNEAWYPSIISTYMPYSKSTSSIYWPASSATVYPMPMLTYTNMVYSSEYPILRSSTMPMSSGVQLMSSISPTSASSFLPKSSSATPSTVKEALDLCPNSLLQNANHRLLRQYGGHCYELCPYQPKDWFSAQEDCASKHGSLFTVTSEKEQNFIQRMLRELKYDYAVWMGLHDLSSEQKWRWVDGKTLNQTGYTHWNSAHKDSVFHNEQDCVLFNGTSGDWKEAVCKGFFLDVQKHPWICQYESISKTGYNSLSTSSTRYFSNTRPYSHVSLSPSTAFAPSFLAHSSSAVTMTPHLTSVVMMSSAITSLTVDGDLALCPLSVLHGTSVELLRQYGDHCYELFPHQPKDWFSAQQECVNKHGTLFTVPSEKEQHFIQRMLTELHYDYSVWMGLHDLSSEQQWHWVDGQPLEKTGYKNWGFPHRDPVYHNEQDCALFTGMTGVWRECVCKGFMFDIQSHPWICQYDTRK